MSNPTLYNDDCFERIKLLPDNHVTGIVCDPPYFINFMNKNWDDMSSLKFYDDMVSLVENSWFPLDIVEVFFYYWAKECLRVAKPGSHLMAFSSPRTYHKMTSGIEKAGWLIRDSMIPWVYNSGMVKGQNISKGIDKYLGVERTIVGSQRLTGNAMTPTKEKGGNFSVGAKPSAPGNVAITVSNSKEGKLWEGYGSNLAPAYEPVVLAVKPWEGSLASNAITHGVAGINHSGCEINGTETIKGRVPKNVMFHHHPDCEFLGKKDCKGYVINRCNNGARPFNGSTGEDWTNFTTDDYTVDTYNCHGDCVVKDLENQINDNPAKFFYCKKASRKEKELGLKDYKDSIVSDGRNKTNDTPYHRGTTERKNIHPTVKPIKLMRYLCRLIKQPENNLILDPFMGSGSCGIAAINEDMDYIGIEISEEYYKIACDRIDYAMAEKPKQTELNF